MASTAQQRPVFVVGTGRCGSTLLSEMIRLHPDVLSVSEWFTVLGERRAADDAMVDLEEFWKLLTTPTPDGIEFLARYPNLPELRIPPDAIVSAGARGLPPILTIPLPHIAADPEEALQDLRRYMATESKQTLAEWQSSAFAFLTRRQGKRMWVERSGGSLAYVDSLCRSWPNARFIHLYRDGVACASSMYGHPYFRVRVARAIARSSVPTAACLDTEIPLEQFGAYWSAVVLRGLDALRSIPEGDVLHVDYADLVEAPARVLREVHEFLADPHVSKEWLNRATNLVRPALSRSASGAPVASRLARACAVGMRELKRLRATERNRSD